MTWLSPDQPRVAATAGPLSHARHWRAGVVQAAPPPGVLDLGPGYLDPALLPVDLVSSAYVSALAEFGSAALSYGANAGARPLRELLAARITARHRCVCGSERILVTAGTSQALQLLCTAVAAPGQFVLVERTCYDLGRRIFADHGLRLREVAADGGGMEPGALDEELAAVCRSGHTPAFVYLTPTFHNPTGTVADTRRRRALLATSARYGVRIVEDDAYAELRLDGGATPAPLAALAEHRGVIRLGSFAKTLGPGLRLGWLEADPELVELLASRGQLVSGGSLNHVTSLAAAVLLCDGRYDRHLTWLRDQLRLRRDTLVAGLRAGLGDEPSFERPAGGFFLWLRFAAGRDESDLVAAAQRAGVAVAAGSRFGSVTGPHIRLAYSFNSPDRLADAAARLAAAWRNDWTEP